MEFKGHYAHQVEASTRWRRRDRETADERLIQENTETPLYRQGLTPAFAGCATDTARVRLSSPQTSEDAKASEAPKKMPSEPCPVCLEGFEKLENGCMPRTCRQCGNSFHQACLSEWARKEQQIKWEQKPWMLPAQFESGSCPCCRSNKGHERSRRWARK
mmetsp:Transcript_116223/g.323672  ORF Transcript_116223/g.323672 Transcript_116223/m.323672 type:complete len:160 (+) Transcript_116223:117-596(+)